jgi:hypothetical protein
LSCKNPTCQYLGNMNNEVQITFECTDQAEVQQLSKVVEQMSATSREQNRVARFNYIRLVNNFVSFFGMQFFTVDNYTVDTAPGTPGLFLINLSLVEYRPGQEANESLIREGVTSQKEIEFVAAFAIEEARLYAKYSKSGLGDRYYYDKVLRTDTGWFNNNVSFIAQFVNGIGGWSDYNIELRDRVMINSDPIDATLGVQKELGNAKLGLNIPEAAMAWVGGSSTSKD